MCVCVGGGIYEVYVHMKKAELKDERTWGNVYLCVHARANIHKRLDTCTYTYVYKCLLICKCNNKFYKPSIHIGANLCMENLTFTEVF